MYVHLSNGLWSIQFLIQDEGSRLCDRRGCECVKRAGRCSPSGLWVEHVRTGCTIKSDAITRSILTARSVHDRSSLSSATAETLESTEMVAGIETVERWPSMMAVHCETDLAMVSSESTVELEVDSVSRLVILEEPSSLEMHFWYMGLETKSEGLKLAARRARLGLLLVLAAFVVEGGSSAACTKCKPWGLSWRKAALNGAADAASVSGMKCIPSGRML